ncbi:MAG TPA: hypothetical protein VF101_00940 [Gaiellaceae bacterium]
MAAIAVAIATDVFGIFQHSVRRIVHRSPPPTARTPPSPLSFRWWRDEEGFDVVSIPRGKSAQLAHAKNCRALEQSAREAGGADPHTTRLAMLVQGRLADTATIIGMRAIVTSRSRATGGAEAECAGGGAESALRLRFNLDSRKPRALRMTGDFDHAVPAGPYFVHGRVITAAKHEVVPLELEGVARRRAVTWRLELTAAIGSRTRRFVIDDHGRPFRTTPHEGGWPVYEWRWWHTPQDMHISHVQP